MRRSSWLLTAKCLGQAEMPLAWMPRTYACGHLAGKVGVLREILEVAAAKGAALGVEARPQQYGDFLRGSFFPHGFAHFLAQFGVPAAWPR